jgi:hypothetical protein
MNFKGGDAEERISEQIPKKEGKAKGEMQKELTLLKEKKMSRWNGLISKKYQLSTSYRKNLYQSIGEAYIRLSFFYFNY